MPFIAVELFSITRERALVNAFGSNCLFLNVNGNLSYFSFVPMAMKETDDGRIPNPKWEQMFAGRHGNFEISEDKRILKLVRALEDNGELMMSPFEAKVVAQLRYEYALNLLQKIGINFSRIGLDFFELSPRGVSDGPSIKN